MPMGWKASIAGLIGSFVLAAIFVLFKSSGMFEQLDVITLIDRLGSIGRTAAWFDHFIVGTLLWGPIFAGFVVTTRPRPRWQKGLAFSVIAWGAMMLFFMPVVGAGLFGFRAGLLTPVGMLALHLIYGLVLGVVFDILDAKFPTKDPAMAQQSQLGGLR